MFRLIRSRASGKGRLMADWAAKRFWKVAAAVPQAGSFAVHLDGRPVRTPAKNPLIVPTFGLATAIAAEWDAQDGRIRPETMPHTRAANSALDKVTPMIGAVVDELAGYGGTDLLCYRATGPGALVARIGQIGQGLRLWRRAHHGRHAVRRQCVHGDHPRRDAGAEVFA